MEWITPLCIVAVGFSIINNQVCICKHLSKIEDLLQENKQQAASNGSALGSIAYDIRGLRKKTPDRIEFDRVTGSETILE